ncbi:sodium-independent anion transporter [Dolichospermum sp. UHCC 0259]|uniref:sodium-independent anion transporter n=1 Tax=Dolichospermum sp. UHCC 0259 TaxID=2590010 RepID=UPI0020C336FC|nr:sodium-independent anion transporter [Dolichospermum sp. UHCC 0259]
MAIQYHCPIFWWHSRHRVKYLILRLRFVPNMDTTGLVALEDIYHDLERHNCRLILTGLQPEVKQLLERSGLLKTIGLSNCFQTTTDAICSISPQIIGCLQPEVTNLKSKELMKLNE